MSQVILHHYPLSPYSEKIRLALGVAGISWNSVEIPVWTPRPKLTPMTGGYRRTPILQVGAEFYCELVAHSSSHRTVGNARFALPEGSGRCRKSSWLVDRKGLFHECRLSHYRQHAGAPTRAHRRTPTALPGQSRSRGFASQAGGLLAEINAHLAWLAEVLADGRQFVLGKEPSAADLSAYHPIWFARQNGGPEVNQLISFPSLIDPWYKKSLALATASSPK